jgi:pimeloyl-ACP methyl ester carboxylesterase
MASTELDAEAEALIEAALRPKRRARPRLAEPLHEAEDRQIDTPVGPVMAWRLGAGPAALLVHGWEDDNGLWGPMIERLMMNRRPVVALDLPGHGWSTAELDGPDAAAEAVRAVGEAFGPVEAVIGHSFGCVALTQAMSFGLQASHAVMIASPIPKTRAKMLDREKERGAPEAVVERAKAIYAARQATAGPMFDVEVAARGMTAKALFVYSMDDAQTPPENGRILADAWPGAELMLTDGLGHRLVAQDETVAARAADFIEDF